MKILYTILGLVSSFLSISGFVVYLYRTDKKEKRKMSPIKITVIYCLGILLLLAVIALISMFIGYQIAAVIAAVIINGLLIGFIGYALVNYIRKKLKSKVALNG